MTDESGQAYPAGYQGPDTQLFMYVDVRAINVQTVPVQTFVYSSNYFLIIGFIKNAFHISLFFCGGYRIHHWDFIS